MLHITEDPSGSGKIFLTCQECGNLYAMQDFRGEIYSDSVAAYLEKESYCESCADKINAKMSAMVEHPSVTKEEFQYKLKVCNIPDSYIHDRETGVLLSSPIVRFVAEWIWIHKDHHLLLSGMTGTGKSTSACFVAMTLLKQGLNVRYATLSSLLSDWRDARKSDNAKADQDFLYFLLHNTHVLIIDECMGKCAMSQSAQEFLFELIEGINSTRSTSRIWLMGNFYEGSIEDIFSDPEPVRRRLQENFCCAYIDTQKQRITPLTVWRKK